jgi:hypothetical protein
MKNKIFILAIPAIVATLLVASFAQAGWVSPYSPLPDRENLECRGFGVDLECRKAPIPEPKEHPPEAPKPSGSGLPSYSYGIARERALNQAICENNVWSEATRILREQGWMESFRYLWSDEPDPECKENTLWLITDFYTSHFGEDNQ